MHRLTRLIGETSHFGAEIGRHILFQIFGYSEFYHEVCLAKFRVEYTFESFEVTCFLYRMMYFVLPDIIRLEDRRMSWLIFFKTTTRVKIFFKFIQCFQRKCQLLSLTGESFLYFDHGPAGNLERYGTTYPPEYNLTLVTAPVYLVHADNDPFAPIEVAHIQRFQFL